MGQRLISIDELPWLWIENIWILIVCSIAIATRLYIRHGMYGMDDFTMVISYLFAIASVVFVFTALNNGLKLSHTPHDKEYSIEMVIISSILWFMSDAISKLSTVALLSRIISKPTRNKKQDITLYTASGSFTIWAILAVSLWVSSCLDSASDRVYPTPSKICIRGVAILTIILVLGSFCEVALFAIAIWLFAKLHMRRMRKYALLSVFAMRLPLIGLYVGFFIAFQQYVGHDSIPFVVYGSALYWQTLVLGYAVVITAAQPFKQIADGLNTSGAVLREDIRTFTAGDSYELGKIQEQITDPDQQDSASLQSNGSKTLIIRKG